MARDFMTHARWDLLPEYMRDGVQRYVLHGIPPGGFLRAVICNDLFDAVGRADEVNALRLTDYCKFFDGYAPHQCYGSLEKYLRWVKQGGLAGEGISRAGDDE